MSSYPTWKDAYSVGNELLDEQHKKLLEIGQKAFRLLAAPYVPPPNFDALLRDYTNAQLTHFAAEEEVLARNGYPKLAEQLAEHDAIRAQLAELLCRAEKGELYMRAMLKLMANSANNHLLQTDMACRDYLKDR